jgi:3-dehydroquinate dehydratase-2
MEVHLSNIYAREEWRAESVIAPIAKGQISGLGWRGYIIALETLVAELKGESI